MHFLYIYIVSLRTPYPSISQKTATTETCPTDSNGLPLVSVGMSTAPEPPNHGHSERRPARHRHSRQRPKLSDEKYYHVHQEQGM